MTSLQHSRLRIRFAAHFYFAYAYGIVAEDLVKASGYPLEMVLEVGGKHVGQVRHGEEERPLVVVWEPGIKRLLRSNPGPCANQFLQFLLGAEGEVGRKLKSRKLTYLTFEKIEVLEPEPVVLEVVEEPVIDHTTPTGKVVGCPQGIDGESPFEEIPGLSVEFLNEGPVIDSRLVAASLGVEHRALIQTIKTHKAKIEERFGTLTFEMSVSKMPDGRPHPNPARFAWLTEDQSLFITTLSRNTERAVDVKAKLVEAFSKARKQVSSQTAPPAPQPLESESQILLLKIELEKKGIELGQVKIELGQEKIRRLEMELSMLNENRPVSAAPIQADNNLPRLSRQHGFAHNLAVRLGEVTPRLIKKYRICRTSSEAIGLLEDLEDNGYGQIVRSTRTTRYRPNLAVSADKLIGASL